MKTRMDKKVLNFERRLGERKGSNYKKMFRRDGKGKGKREGEKAGN
jgi:hypothetical protein